MLLALWEIAELTKGRLLSGNTSRGAAWTAGLDSGDSLSWKSSEQGSSCGSGLGRQGDEADGRVWGQNRVRSESGQSARSLEPGKWQGCLEVISSLLLLLGPASADGAPPAEDPHRGALSRNANSPAVTCRAPRSSSQLSLKASRTKRHEPEGLQGACTSFWRRAGRQDGPQLVWSPPGRSPGRGSRCAHRVAGVTEGGSDQSWLARSTQRQEAQMLCF